MLSKIYGRDELEFPEYFERRGNLGGREVVCAGPLKYTGQAAIQTDIDNFKAALNGVDLAEAYLPAVAPGTIEHWMDNEHYQSDEEFLTATADALKVEYKAIIDAGFILQIDDPGLPCTLGLAGTRIKLRGVPPLRRYSNRDAEACAGGPAAGEGEIPHLLG